MPANLPPAYHQAEQRFREATTPQDKIAALEEMLRIMPKHKGTDKLQADIKARIARLRRQPRKSAATHSHSHMVPREGAGQIALVGPPNAGKSALVTRLTHAHPEVAEYPFSTREPVPGMMPFEDIAIQLVDLPPVCDEHVEPWVYDLVRRADLLWIVLRHSSSLDGLESTLRLLAAKRIYPHPAGEEPQDDGEYELGRLDREALLVITGLDRPGAAESVDVLRELLDRPWPLLPASAVTGDGLDRLARRTFEALGIVRIYTKQPGKPADRGQPFTMSRGSTVGDLARAIHKDISDRLRFARIWGRDVFDGQTVQREHVLAEGDVVELHV